MNIYMITEDGEQKLWKAETMEAAMKLAENAYIEEGGLDGSEEEERVHYRESLIESCTLIGKLANS